MAMSKAKLDQFKLDYTTLSWSDLVQKYGKAQRTLENWARKYDIHRSYQYKARQDILLTDNGLMTPQAYPKFDIKPFKTKKNQRDTEDIGIILSDHHAGRITPEYNSKIYQERMDTLLDSVMDIINLHRPIRRAYVLDAGDGIQGENVYQGSKVGDVEMPAINQIFDLSVPTLSRFLVSVSQGVEELHYFGVRGNHGRMTDKGAPDGTNWDTFKIKMISLALQNQENIHVDSSGEFYRLINIQGFRFFLFHGDQVRASNGIPLFAMKRKLQEWYAHFGGFNYAYCGHWHTWASDMVNEHADYTICPPLVTGDSWALEKIGRSSLPIQLAFGVHPRRGRTWEYKLYADKIYLPEPIERKDEIQ